MKISRLFTVALAVAAPSIVVADDTKSEDLSKQEERQMKEDREATSDIDKPKVSDIESKDEDKDAMKLRSHVLPAVAGIEAADKAIGALYELTSEDTINVRDVRETVALARQAITLATDRADSLNAMTSLSDDADSEADRASTKLEEARTTLVRIDKQLKKGKLSRNQIEQVHEAARDVHQDLSDASNAVERVAKAYDVPTDFEFEG